MYLNMWLRQFKWSLEADIFNFSHTESLQTLFKDNDQYTVKNDQAHKETKHQEWEPAETIKSKNNIIKTSDIGLINKRS